MGRYKKVFTVGSRVVSSSPRFREEGSGKIENDSLTGLADGLIRFTGGLAEKHLIRGFDSIHLASAIHLKNKARSETYFSSTDIRLNQSAEKESVIVLS